MKPSPALRNPGSHAGPLALLALGVTALPVQAWQLATNLTLNAELAVRETFDSNVYLQDQAPSPLVAGAAQPFQESFVTTVIPRLALDWKPAVEFGLSASYAPEVVTYHAEPSESHVAHRAGLTFAGKVQDIAWEQFNTFTWIDGSEEGLTFGIVDPVTGRPAGAPAIGGIPLRDRREAVVYRNGFRAHHPVGRWFFRPVLASYVHDFRTEERNPRDFPFYQNYVDRNDFNTGIEVGYRVVKDVHAVVGYRFGYQMEPPLPGSTVDYSNHYHRAVAGIEGKVAPWFQLNLSLGPAYHDFDHATPDGFDDHRVLLYVDSSAVLTPSAMDTVTLSVKQFMQPAFGSPSAYEDITYDAFWRHRFCDHTAFQIGFRTYGGDWLNPVQRSDWIFTPSAGFDVTVNRHLSIAAAYSYDWVDSEVPNTDGREFTRHLGTLSARYRF